jgi:hypothetical protein
MTPRDYEKAYCCDMCDDREQLLQVETELDKKMYENIKFNLDTQPLFSVIEAKFEKRSIN